MLVMVGLLPLRSLTLSELYIPNKRSLGLVAQLLIQASVSTSGQAGIDPNMDQKVRHASPNSLHTKFIAMLYAYLQVVDHYYTALWLLATIRYHNHSLGLYCGTEPHEIDNNMSFKSG